jgi:sugar O-acyltransferase (sialic acid O-acetyltransferase NeuD family)
MKEVIIIGAGGHAAEIDEYINHAQKISGVRDILIKGFLDDCQDSYESYRFSAPYLGKLSTHRIKAGQRYIIGIADPRFRKHFVDKFKSKGAEFVSFVHDSTYVSASAVIGEGTVIGPNANIGPNVRVGKYNLINSRCSLGHDTVIGSFNIICPNVCFSGFSKVGDENMFGMNSATIPEISVGNRNKIVAGMVLDQSVGDDSCVFYRHKERVIAVPRLVG